jgi:hypothetical protein
MILGRANCVFLTAAPLPALLNLHVFHRLHAEVQAQLAVLDSIMQ